MPAHPIVLAFNILREDKTISGIRKLNYLVSKLYKIVALKENLVTFVS